MKHNGRNLSKALVFVLPAILLLLIGTVVQAQSDNYDLTWWTVDNGGGTSQSGDGQYTLSGTIGQWDANSASRDGYTINGGFWSAPSTTIQEFLIHLPLVLR